jgi:hypothetical protein
MGTYYTTDESVTNRTDIDATMKWVVTNIDNKLRIPPEKLPDGKYTWSVSNVVAEMGLPYSTTYYRFKMLERLKVLTERGTIRTTHGDVVIYDADRDVFSKLLSGELKIPDGLLTEVRKSKKGSSAGDEVGSSPTDRPSSPTDIPLSDGDRASSPAETSNQIQHSNVSSQKLPEPNGAQEPTEWNMGAYQKEIDALSDLSLKRLVADEIKTKLRTFRENGLGNFRPPFQDFLKAAKTRQHIRWSNESYGLS